MLSGEYELARTGVRLPLGQMIRAMKRHQLVNDVLEPKRRSYWINHGEKYLEELRSPKELGWEPDYENYIVRGDGSIDYVKTLLIKHRTQGTAGGAAGGGRRSTAQRASSDDEEANKKLLAALAGKGGGSGRASLDALSPRGRARNARWVAVLDEAASGGEGPSPYQRGTSERAVAAGDASKEPSLAELPSSASVVLMTAQPSLLMPIPDAQPSSYYHAQPRSSWPPAEGAAAAALALHASRATAPGPLLVAAPGGDSPDRSPRGRSQEMLPQISWADGDSVTELSHRQQQLARAQQQQQQQRHRQQAEGAPVVAPHRLSMYALSPIPDGERDTPEPVFSGPSEPGALASGGSSPQLSPDPSATTIPALLPAAATSDGAAATPERCAWAPPSPSVSRPEDRVSPSAAASVALSALQRLPAPPPRQHQLQPIRLADYTGVLPTGVASTSAAAPNASSVAAGRGAAPSSTAAAPGPPAGIKLVPKLQLGNLPTGGSGWSYRSPHLPPPGSSRGEPSGPFSRLLASSARTINSSRTSAPPLPGSAAHLPPGISAASARAAQHAGGGDAAVSAAAAPPASSRRHTDSILTRSAQEFHLPPGTAMVGPSAAAPADLRMSGSSLRGSSGGGGRRSTDDAAALLPDMRRLPAVHLPAADYGARMRRSFDSVVAVPSGVPAASRDGAAAQPPAAYLDVLLQRTLSPRRVTLGSPHQKNANDMRLMPE